MTGNLFKLLLSFFSEDTAAEPNQKEEDNCSSNQ